MKSTAIFRFIVLTTLSLGFTACQFANSLKTTATALKTATPAVPVPVYSTSTPSAETPLPFPTDAALPDETVPEPQVLPGVLGGAQNPLRFVFPAAIPPPESAWRPPLYNVPWALSPHDHFYFTRPIAADQVNWPLADYRYGFIYPGTQIVHTGVDIDARKGTPVLAAAPGTVIWVGYGLFSGTHNMMDPYGLAVAIRHDFGFNGKRLYTIYAHMDETTVQLMQVVKAGDQLGRVGETGNVTGPHLHFEVRVGRNDFFSSRNPELWLAPPQGWGVLVGRVLNDKGEMLHESTVEVNSISTGQTWYLATYGGRTIHYDDYYGENVAVSDLPAGRYRVWVSYEDGVYQHEVEIAPGRVTYFSFRGKYLFSDELPSDGPEDFLQPNQ